MHTLGPPGAVHSNSTCTTAGTRTVRRGGRLVRSAAGAQVLDVDAAALDVAERPTLRALLLRSLFHRLPNEGLEEDDGGLLLRVERTGNVGPAGLEDTLDPLAGVHVLLERLTGNRFDGLVDLVSREVLEPVERDEEARAEGTHRQDLDRVVVLLVQGEAGVRVDPVPEAVCGAKDVIRGRSGGGGGVGLARARVERIASAVLRAVAREVVLAREERMKARAVVALEEAVHEHFPVASDIEQQRRVVLEGREVVCGEKTSRDFAHRLRERHLGRRREAHEHQPVPLLAGNLRACP